MTARRAGYWIGAVVCFLLGGFLMVQLRAKVFGTYPSGDWPADGYTWHFIPAFGVVVAGWLVLGIVAARRNDVSLSEGMSRVGLAAYPGLGLIIAWTWYGLTGLHFHRAGGCTVYLLCHDVGRSPVLFWTIPWLLASGWSVYRHALRSDLDITHGRH